MILQRGGLVMLYEIRCNEFKQKSIIFHQGLNTILGDDIGSNSIGKSTFLMIIDFVFGGKDYMMQSSNNIEKNIGNHIINFCFEFDEKRYYFSRNTDDLETVNQCDSRYKISKKFSLDEYCDFLKSHYYIDLDNIKFRNIVGRFARIYGKDNLDEKHPLNIVKNEKAGEPVKALLKLFNLYKYIERLDYLLKEKENEYNAFINAQKYNYVSNIGKRKFISNEKELYELKIKIDDISSELDNKLLDLDTVKTDELLGLKNELSKAKRKRSHLKAQLQNIENNIKENSTLSSQKMEELFTFFPESEKRKFEEIEKFHIEIRNVLKIELKQKKKELEGLIQISNLFIEDIEKNIKSISSCENLSKAILIKYSNLQKRIDSLKQENEAFEKKEILKIAKNDAKERRDNMKKEQLEKLQLSINNKMLIINDYIYESRKKPPIIKFDGNQYDFHTIDDSGTGTSYKSMIVYDLSILDLTELPILIHDSVILKQISDVAVEKILELYSSSKKQIFISFDKLSAYSNKTQELLKNNKVLGLSPGGNELFGRSWNDR